MISFSSTFPIKSAVGVSHCHKLMTAGYTPPLRRLGVSARASDQLFFALDVDKIGYLVLCFACFWYVFLLWLSLDTVQTYDICWLLLLLLGMTITSITVRIIMLAIDIVMIMVPTGSCS